MIVWRERWTHWAFQRERSFPCFCWAESGHQVGEEVNVSWPASSSLPLDFTRLNGMIMHRPVPGPLYWDYRCLVCSEPVADHASWWDRLREKLRRSR